MVISNLQQSVKVREGSVKGNVKVNSVTLELPHSVKVREGSVKRYVKVR